MVSVPVQTRKLSVAFIHPDLGLGGAERLVVDAAVETVQHGHQCHVYTAYYDPQRCFEETKSGTFTVSVAGNWFPRHIYGRCYALCAYIRCLLVALHVITLCYHTSKHYDVIVVDQVSVVSVVIPFLRAFLSSRVLFYCHFPDLLLAKHSSILRKLYRGPLDAVEQATTGMADMVLVNSKFTGGVFASTFTRLAARGVRPRVLYPAIQIPEEALLQEVGAVWREELAPAMVEFISKGPVLLSINRFERKKGLELALEALHEHLQRNPGSSARLILAGGYDRRLQENVDVHSSLLQRAADLHLSDRVSTLPSFTDRQRHLLLAACVAVLYTPQDEHFGIVPLEAMAARRPVVACRSGGPIESIVDGETGFLVDPTPAAFCEAVGKLLEEGKAAEMGEKARRHVQGKFARLAFGDELDACYQRLVQGNEQ